MHKLYFKYINSKILNITIFNEQGEQILSRKSNFDFIDISNLKHGIYFIKISNSNKTTIDKFIKE